MRILAIETVETTGTLAALDDERVVAERALDPSRRSAQSLAPGIDALLSEVGWHANDVELVAVANGPGSFTGLRIGVTTAKVFAYAIGCQVVGVHTLRAIAERVPSDIDRFAVVLDAQRGELFVADFRRSIDGHLEGHETTRVVNRDECIAGLTSGDVVTGPGLAKIEGPLPSGVLALDADLWPPTASAVGKVGWQLFAAGERISPFDLVPQYFRRTAAEEQWRRKTRR